MRSPIITVPSWRAPRSASRASVPSSLSLENIPRRRSVDRRPMTVALVELPCLDIRLSPPASSQMRTEIVDPRRPSSAFLESCALGILGWARWAMAASPGGLGRGRVLPTTTTVILSQAFHRPLLPPTTRRCPCSVSALCRCSRLIVRVYRTNPLGKYHIHTTDSDDQRGHGQLLVSKPAKIELYVCCYSLPILDWNPWLVPAHYPHTPAHI
ncbi:hypothetical protein LXA43DRAFT_244058 [Ganoderma leucocontextum]|nr:hypothetical protein LXA43DRAFT_244058 [Ganoderma leucocontextum]